MANFFHLTDLKDEFDGTSVQDVIFGYDGDDKIWGWGGNDWLVGGYGNDQLYGGDGDDWLLGGEGHDRLYGGEGDDWLNGGNGNDVFYGDEGADKMIGGSGEDWVSYRDSVGPVSVDLGLGAGFMGDSKGDSYASIEHAIGSDYDDYFLGTEGINWFYGYAGDDFFYGSGGADIFHGGSGALDAAYYLYSPEAVSINLSTNVNTGGDAEGDKLYSIERVQGSDFNDTIKGSNADENLNGNHGDDKIFGYGGDDRIRAGDGDDHIYGGSGDDVIYTDGGADWVYGGAGADKIIGRDDAWVSYFWDGEHHENEMDAVIVDLKAGVGVGGHAEGDTYEALKNVMGTKQDDQLLGDYWANQLRGSWGDDYLAGRRDADTLEGGFGNDTLDGGNHADVLSGGHGGDTFVYSEASESTSEHMDVIDHWDDQWSFKYGREYDKFDFRALDADDKTDGNQALEWVGISAFNDVGQVHQVVAGAVTYVRVNLDDDFGTSEMEIKIDQSVTLEADDFLL